ncbi:hypothetical protein VTI74DRAFT_10254 [Chaetomium olivicolor]
MTSAYSRAPLIPSSTFFSLVSSTFASFIVSGSSTTHAPPATATTHSKGRQPARSLDGISTTSNTGCRIPQAQSQHHNVSIAKCIFHSRDSILSHRTIPRAMEIVMARYRLPFQTPHLSRNPQTERNASKHGRVPRIERN